MHKCILGWAYTPWMGRGVGVGKFLFFVYYQGRAKEVFKLIRKRIYKSKCISPSQVGRIRRGMGGG